MLVERYSKKIVHNNCLQQFFKIPVSIPDVYYN